ncbi:cytochrome P450 94A1-like [Juglans microcarpa x Juglans regia]|uniref:cytochrome P450 94A1-like n=1 Tax=Juglans microcarpa x Juglans regia TaxID=2249226 RepID=UPI001B7E3859|nr:cytochrome P450 94A1-like [Juglans microcarpa x Juglans regia]
MDQFSVQSFFFFFLLSIYVYLLFKYTSKKKPIHKGFKVYPILGTLPELLQNRHRFLDWTTETLDNCLTNTSVFRRPGKIQGVITSNPANVEHVLKTNFENYPKGDCIITLLGDFLGRGIFNSDGELWMVQRKTASYEFNTKSLRNFVMENVNVETKTRLVPILSKASETARVLDFQDILERFAFDNVCKLAFNVDPCSLGGDGTVGAKFMRAFEDAATLSSGRFLYAIPILGKLKKFLNIGSERRLRDAIKTVHEFADDIIRSRLEQKVDKDADLLSRFIANEANSPEFLRDIVISFILAGRDTTSSALSWFIWLLWSKPEVERNILKELEKIQVHRGKNLGDSYSFDELRDMQYLHAAIKEAMRLYPPVPIDTKACLNDDIMPDGTFVKKGWIVAYHTYAMGRMESIWGKNCREFLPERWLEKGVCRQVSPYKFPVFHAGPRMCLGKELAYIQMKSIAASMIERFEIDVVNKNKGLEPLMSLTLRIKGGLPVKVRKRCGCH